MTPFGKLIRHYRIDHEMLMGDMADALTISASYLSQIETGKKPIPPGFVDRVGRLFNLQGVDLQALREAAAQSTTEFRIKLDDRAPAQERLIAQELALEFARLSPDAKNQIHKIIRGA